MEKAKLHVKKGDTVVVVSGSKDHTDKKTGEFKPGIRGKTGKVKAVYPDKQMVLVEGVNLIKKAVRPTPQKPQGGFSEQEAPLHASKVRPICPSCGKPTRVRHKAIEEVIGKNADGSNKVKTRRLRICAQCEGSLDTKDNK